MTKIISLFFSIPLFFLSVALPHLSAAQSPSLPPFEMALSTGKVFKVSRDLPKGKPVIVIYFDPDCDHCQKLMAQLFKKINNFKNAEIVMITFKLIPELSAFEKKYGTRKYPNIRVGSEGNYFYLRDYYKLVKMPFTALYDKKQNLVYSYRDETSLADLIKRLREL